MMIVHPEAEGGGGTFLSFVTCPYCGKQHELASNVKLPGDHSPPREPIDGDLTLCIGCGRWLFFDSTAEGGLRKPTPKERTSLRVNPQYRRIVRAWAQTARELGKKRGKKI